VGFKTTKRGEIYIMRGGDKRTALSEREGHLNVGGRRKGGA